MKSLPRARYASLSGYEDACREAGVDPGATLRSCGLDPGELGRPEAWATAADVATAIDRAVTTSATPTLALRMARRRGLSALGPISLVLREEPTCKDALDLIARFWPTYNEALRLGITATPMTTAVTIRFAFGRPAPHERATELVLAVLVSMVGVLSPGTVPLSVRLRHPCPGDQECFSQFFGVPVEFGGLDDRVTFATADLLAPRDVSDPQQRAHAHQLLDIFALAHDLTPGEQVLRLVADLLPTGRCTVERVASALDVDRRTVLRRLAAEGTTFREALDDERRRRAELLVADPTRPLTQVAQALGFTTPSSFSRWFAGTYGVSASRMRAARCAPADITSSP